MSPALKRTNDLSDSPAFVDIPAPAHIRYLNRRAISTWRFTLQYLCFSKNLLFIDTITHRFPKHSAIERLAAANTLQCQDRRRDVDVRGSSRNRNSMLEVDSP